MSKLKLIVPFFVYLLFNDPALAAEKNACNVEEFKPVFADIEKTDQAIRIEFGTNYDKALADSKSRGVPMDSAVFDALFAPMKKVDAMNQERLEKIVAECGWPSADNFGVSAVRTAFLVVQHASIEVQKKYFVNIEQNFKQGHLAKPNFAMLVDRMLMREGKEQRYGTQSQISKDGVKTLFPVEDPENLNARRIAMDMEPNAGFPMPVKP